MSFWRDRTFRTLVLAAVLVAAVGMVRPGNMSGMYIPQFWQTKARMHGCADVVIAGDSRSAIAVSPAAMMEVLDNTRVVNFGFYGNGYSEDYLAALTEVLDGESDEQTIVFGVSPRSFTRGAATMNMFKAYQRIADSEVFLTRTFAELLRFTEPMDLGKALESTLRQENRDTLYQCFWADGWIASRDENPRQDRKLDNYVREFQGNPVDEGIVEQLLEQVRRYREEGILVIGFRPPTTAEMEAIEDEYSGLDYEGFVRRFEEAGGVWLRLEGEYFSYDGSHMDRDSAVMLSRELASQISAYRQGVARGVR
ncbi:MAG: hypothetical protein JW936_04360 [Sedimentisphaerales bacterium]|nr:hypothetical protein [Sedimentisphaerales bacterium]